MLGRLRRQRMLVPEDIVRETPVLILGVGATGRNLALMVAAMGCRDMTIVDFDEVAETNIASQGYGVSAVGKPKVEALAEELKAYDPEIKVTALNEAYAPHHLQPKSVVFVAVDVMSVRKDIWHDIQKKSILERPRLLLESRIGGELFQVMTVDPTSEEDIEWYPETLYTDEQAIDTGCAGNMTMYVACATAAFLCKQYAACMRKWSSPNASLPIERDIMVDLQNGEWLSAAAREEAAAGWA